MATTVHPPASLGRAPRFGMGWVTWRQHRAMLAGACGVLGVMIGYMLVTGLQMRSVLSSLGLDTCHPPTTSWCATAVGLFNSDYDVWRNNGLVACSARRPGSTSARSPCCSITGTGCR